MRSGDQRSAEEHDDGQQDECHGGRNISKREAHGDESGGSLFEAHGAGLGAEQVEPHGDGCLNPANMLDIFSLVSKTFVGKLTHLDCCLVCAV